MIQQKVKYQEGIDKLVCRIVLPASACSYVFSVCDFYTYVNVVEEGCLCQQEWQCTDSNTSKAKLQHASVVQAALEFFHYTCL